MEKFLKWSITRRSRRYQVAFAAGACVTALGTRLYLDPILPPGFPFLTIFPAVILTSFFAGTLPGVAVAVICGLAAWYLLLDPVYSFALSGPSILAMLFYLLIVSTELVLLDFMRRALVRLDDETERSLSLAQANKTMFHELQHRVSNNLQVVASLLKMQRRNVTDEAAKSALDAATARIQAVADIQRRLHNPKRQTTDMSQLLRDVLPSVVSNSALSDRITLEFDSDPVLVTGDQATPLALIVVELVSNAVEHAGDGGAPLTLTITLRHQGDQATIVVQDNGKGLPADFVPEKSRSLGLRVALQFTEQLGGHLQFENRGGARVTLTLPLDRAAG